jgi:hypothetical protein
MYASVAPTAGLQPLNDWFSPDTTQRHPLGFTVTAVDPFWGEGQFIYVKSNDAILKGSCCIIGTPNTYLATLMPSTAGLGQPVGFAIAPMASGTYGWLQIAGGTVVKTNATVAADAVIGVAAAGILGTNTNGKQLLNFHNVKAATATVTATVNTINGSGVLTFANGYDGFFLGIVITGTGIAAATTVIAKLDPDGRTAYTGSAIGTLGDKPSTATGSITLTGTYTGFGLGIAQYPFTQGAIL